MHNPSRWLSISALALCVSGLVASAAARADEDYPAHSINVIIPTGPGGGTDVTIRLLSQIASQILKTNLVILNRPGAGGEIGTSTVVRAKPDGYTIGGIWNAPLTMTPWTLPASYKPDDYIPITRSDTAPMVLCVKADFPANSGKEFIDYAKKNPGKLSYGNDGVGASVQLAAERVFAKVGIKLNAIPFSGAGETLQSFLSNQIAVYGGSIQPIVPYIKNGTAKCLLATGAKQVAGIPQATTLTELGIPQEETLLWHGIIVPKGTPPDRIAILEKAFREASHSDKFVAYLKSQSVDPDGSSVAQTRKIVDNEYTAMGQVVKSLGLDKPR